MSRLKYLVYTTAKYLGVFALSRILTRKKLRILCYHGFSYTDEHHFRPKLFISPETFRKRMEALQKARFTVISLDKALEYLNAGSFPDNTIVITFDDGWTGVRDFGLPILKTLNFPWTLYLTTYYVENQIQVINLMVQYLFWKSPRENIDFSPMGNKFADDKAIDTSEHSTFEKKLIEYIDAQPRIAERQEFLNRLGMLMGVDVSSDEMAKKFRLVDAKSVRVLYQAGVDIQLHSHRHTIDEQDMDLFEEELNQNAQSIKKITGKQAQHFCFPSGYFETQHVRWLSKSTIKSATICEPGLVKAGDNRHTLRRFLDGENISQIEFEAEVYGFSELLRQLRSRLSGFYKNRQGLPDF